MTKIQLDLSDEEDYYTEAHKLKNKLKTKQDAIKSMISAFDAEIEYKNPGAKKYNENINIEKKLKKNKKMEDGIPGLPELF